MKIDLVVTRHQGLVDYLIEEKIVTPDVPVLPHATAEDLRGKRVVGVLPIHLAAECERVVVIPLDLPAELRGGELTADQVRKYASPPVEYSVCRIDYLSTLQWKYRE